MAKENAVNKEETGESHVTGQVLIPAAVAGFAGATVHVRLEELSGEDDKGARVKAETVIPNVTHDPSAGGGDGTLIPFAIRVEGGAAALDPANEYAVRVWIDSDSDGKKGAGDLYSDERHRVLDGGPARPLIIKVVQR